LEGVFFPIQSISFEEYVKILEEEFPVYGDLLRFFTIRIGDLPYDMATWLLKVGTFYNELQKIVNNMLDAYVKFAFLEANYVPLGLLEVAEEFEEDPKEVTIEFIDSLLKGEEKYIIVDKYINLENPKECIRVKLLRFLPNIWNNKVLIFAQSIEEEVDDILKKLTEPIKGIENLSHLIVVDPLTYRLVKNYIRELKQKLEEKIGNKTVLSTHELLDLLALDREKFEADWSSLRTKAVKILKEKYPFLSIHDEMWRIRLAKKEIREALADLSKTELREKDYREIIWRISNAIEAYLGVLYHRWKNKPPEEKTLGWLLNSLRSEIEAEFGGDVYNDLSFINEKRKIVDHPKPIRITVDDAIKVARKAELFQDLFLMRLSLKGD